MKRTKMREQLKSTFVVQKIFKKWRTKMLHLTQAHENGNVRTQTDVHAHIFITF